MANRKLPTHERHSDGPQGNGGPAVVTVEQSACSSPQPRRRGFRIILALVAVVLLAALWLPFALVWTPFGAASPVYEEVQETNLLWKNPIRDEWIKDIAFVIPLYDLEATREVSVSIGEKKFTFSKDEFLSQWRFEMCDGGKAFKATAPPSVRGERSCLPWKKDIINWPGDWAALKATFPWYYVGIWCSLAGILVGVRLYKRFSARTALAAVPDALNFIWRGSRCDTCFCCWPASWPSAFTGSTAGFCTRSVTRICLTTCPTGRCCKALRQQGAGQGHVPGEGTELFC